MIDDIRFEPGIFKDSLYVIPKRAELLAAIPGDHEGELRLYVAKRYRQEVQRFVVEVLQKRHEVRPDLER